MTYVQYLLKFKMIPHSQSYISRKMHIQDMHDYKVILMLQVVNYEKNPEFLFG